MLHPIGFWVPGEEDVVTVSGGSFSAFNQDADATQEIWFDANDGNCYESENLGSAVQINSADDWLRPTSSAPGNYETRYTNHTGDSMTVTIGGSAASEDTWYNFANGDFLFKITDSSPGFGGNSATFTVEIRLDGGPPSDSGSYTISADREDTV